MGRFVSGSAPSVDRALADALAAIGSEISALRIPDLQGVVLGGGYGRGEGGVRNVNGAERLSNDLDFFAVAVEGATDADASAISAALEPLARRWTEKLGVDVDFTSRTPWRLRHDQERLMVQELIHGYVDVAGSCGKELFAGIDRRDPSALPWMEAARLLMNRGVGLLLAMERRPADFVSRNINKCILGAGDALLVSRGLYRWRAEDRKAALAAHGDDGLYARALEWKSRPREEPVCDWETARGRWLGAKVEVFAAADEAVRRRSLRNAARWLVRRRSLGAPGTFGQDPVVRILARVAGCIEGRRPLDSSLRRDWEIFN